MVRLLFDGNLEDKEKIASIEDIQLDLLASFVDFEQKFTNNNFTPGIIEAIRKLKFKQKLRILNLRSYLWQKKERK